MFNKYKKEQGHFKSKLFKEGENIDEWIEQKRETLNCPEFTYHYITYARK